MSYADYFGFDTPMTIEKAHEEGRLWEISHPQYGSLQVIADTEEQAIRSFIEHHANPVVGDPLPEDCETVRKTRMVIQRGGV